MLRALWDPRLCGSAACLLASAAAADGAASSSAPVLRWPRSLASATTTSSVSSSSSSVSSSSVSASSSFLSDGGGFGFAAERVLLGGGLLQMNRNDRKPRRGQKSRPVSNYLRKQKARSHTKPKYVKPQPKALESIPSPVRTVEAALTAKREAARFT